MPHPPASVNGRAARVRGVRTPSTAARAQVAAPAATATSLAVLYATEEPKPAQPNDPTADVNGCGPGWGAKFVPEKPGGYDFHKACNDHDRCYQTLGKTKKQCDDEFEAAMKEVCDSTEKKITLWTWKWDKKMGKFVKTKLNEIDYSDAAKAEMQGLGRRVHDGGPRQARRPSPTSPARKRRRRRTLRGSRKRRSLTKT